MVIQPEIKKRQHINDTKSRIDLTTSTHSKKRKKNVSFEHVLLE